jgi:glycosyltransferase involved in cell wall biosynthesis
VFMKILHVDTEKSWRGGEQQLLYLVEGLMERGITCAVACTGESSLMARCRERGIKVHRLSGNQLADTFRLAIIGRRYDIIHAHTARAQNICTASKVFHGKPVVYTRRIDYMPSRDPFTRLKYRLTDATVAVSRAVADVLERYGLKGVKVIHSVVDPNMLSRVNTEKVEAIRKELPADRIVGTVSALTPQKNIPLFLRSAELLLKKHEGVAFLIVGDGPLMDDVKKKARELGIHRRLLLAGFKRDVQNYIKALDVFVLTSDNEGFSGALLQAMLLRVPVVSTTAGGAEEVIVNGETGFVVPRGDPTAIADAVSRLLEDEELRRRIVSRAYSTVVENFTVGRMVEAYTRVYGEVTGGRIPVGKVPE